MDYRSFSRPAVTIAGLVVLVTMISGPLKAQPQQSVAFEVASVKPGDPQPRTAGIQFLPNGTMVAKSFPLNLLIQETFEIGAFQIIGLRRFTSGWSTTRFDIQAKASNPAASRDELKGMAQALLADR